MVDVKKWSILICLFALMGFCLSIFVRVGTSKILWDRFHVEKALRMVFFDDKIFVEGKIGKYRQVKYVDIDWADKYPFEREDGKEERAISTNVNLTSWLRNYESKVRSVENKISGYAEQNLIAHIKIAEIFRKYCVLMGKDINIAAGSILQMPDGYLVDLCEKADVNAKADSVIEFSAYCKAQGVPLVYVCAPSKVCENDVGVYGVKDFSNQNADAFLERLAKNCVLYVDLRENIRKQDLNHHELFFKTDHHWQPDAALWAAREVSIWLNNNVGFDIDTNLLRKENFTEVKYEKYFLGSQGKKVTLALAEPEDISLYYFCQPTFMHMVVPNCRVDEMGDFSVWYDMEKMESVDYYSRDPYSAYGYGTVPLLKLYNASAASDKKIMVIRDSFGNTFCPFFSLGAQTSQYKNTC